MTSEGTYMDFDRDGAARMRRECIELAMKAGATSISNVLAAAQRIEAYLQGPDTKVAAVTSGKLSLNEARVLPDSPPPDVPMPPLQEAKDGESPRYESMREYMQRRSFERAAETLRHQRFTRMQADRLAALVQASRL